MTHESIRRSFALILTLTGAVAACKGEPNSPPPQNPADVTTTTGATTTEPSNEYATGSSSARAQATNPVADPTATHGTAELPSPMSTPGTTPAPAGLATSARSSDTPAADATPLGDPQIVAVIQTADRGEIAQAREAVKLAKNDRVKRFARHMIADHSGAETKIAAVDDKAGIAPQTSAVSEQLKGGGDQIMTNLKSAGVDFDKAYMDAQVKEHQQVLELLDDKLIPRAQNEDLRKALQEIRTKVTGHLMDAREIQGSLSNAK